MAGARNIMLNKWAQNAVSQVRNDRGHEFITVRSLGCSHARARAPRNQSLGGLAAILLRSADRQINRALAIVTLTYAENDQISGPRPGPSRITMPSQIRFMSRDSPTRVTSGPANPLSTVIVHPQTDFCWITSRTIITQSNSVILYSIIS